MTDPGTAQNLPDLGTLIIAIGALGTAAYGLVDVSKALWGGISNTGFGFVARALKPFDAALKGAVGAQWQKVMKAHWLNGRPKAEIKAIAKSLIRLGLSPNNATPMAAAGQVNPVALTVAATNLDQGLPLTPQDINVLGRFDASVDAIMDAALERADQQYRNLSKAMAAVVAVLLAIAAAWELNPKDPELVKAILVGLVSVPLAPIAKDVSTALSVAIRALKPGKG